MNPFLSVEELSVYFPTMKAVDHVSFSMEAGEIVGIVGESGCGKTSLAKALVKLLPPSCYLSGKVEYQGISLSSLSEKALEKVRGKEIGMIFQDPMSSLNPTLKIQDQIIEGKLRHYPELSYKDAYAQMLDTLHLVGIPDPKRRASEYPHTLSGGMRQRAMIALALSAHPQLLIADEPTTALDVTIQAQILEMLRSLQKQLNMSILLITHDLSIVANFCTKVIVMYAGKIVETASVHDLFESPQHPYTKRLLQTIPRLDTPKNSPLHPITGSPPNLQNLPSGCRFCSRCPVPLRICVQEEPPLYSTGKGQAACFHFDPRNSVYPKKHSQENPFSADFPLSSIKTSSTQKLIEVKHLVKHFSTSKGIVKAVEGVSFSLEAGKTLGLVGESGCGKSTVGKMLLCLEGATSGEIFFEEKNLATLSPKDLKRFRKDAQIIFQDPYASLNPRMTAGDIIKEPLDIHQKGTREEKEARVEELLHLVGLSPLAKNLFPHEFSGGQRQRIGIARALALSPRFLVCDEPISALDVSVQAQIVNLLKTLQQHMGLTYLFISHDLKVVKYLSDTIAVMYLGQIVELAPAEALYRSPKHPYTEALLAAIPVPCPKIERERKKQLLQGEIPSPLAPPPGCPFAPRCSKAKEECWHSRPPMKEVDKEHKVACFLY